jgi:hypothetical protein
MAGNPHGNRYGQDARDEFVELICREGASPVRAARLLGIGIQTAARWRRKYVGMTAIELRDYAPFTIEHDEIGRGLSFEERVVIQAGIRDGRTQSRIAADIGRDRSVVGYGRTWRNSCRWAAPTASRARPRTCGDERCMRTRSRSVNARPRSTTVPCRDIGKAI